MNWRESPPFVFDLIKGPGYRVQYQNDGNGLFKIIFDQRHQGLQIKDVLGLYSGLAGVTHVSLPPAPGAPETWRLRYNYRTVSVSRKVGSGPEVPFTSSSIAKPLPEWLDNITESVTGPNTTANAIVDGRTMGGVPLVQPGSVNVKESGYTLPSKYIWEGVIGNTSYCQNCLPGGQPGNIHSGAKVHAAFRPIKKMIINPGTTEGFYIVGYNEPRWDAVKFNTENPLEVVRPNIGIPHGDGVDAPDDIAIRSVSDSDPTKSLWIKRASGKIQRFTLAGDKIDQDSIDDFGFPSGETRLDDPPDSEIEAITGIIARAQHDDTENTEDRIAVYSETTQQVFVFKRNPSNLNDWIQDFIIGRANGYATGTDIVQSTDSDFRTKLRLDGRYWDDGIPASQGGPQWVPRAALCYDNQRRLWVSDTATSRMIRFNPDGTHDGKIIGWPVKSYASSVDSQDATRAFNGYLEYEVDYSLPLTAPGAWKLVRYWGHFEERGSDLANGLVSVRRFSNNETYAVAYNHPIAHGGNAGRGRVVRLDTAYNGGAGMVQNTALLGAAKLGALTVFEPDGAIHSIQQATRSDLSTPLLATFRRRAVTGFAGDAGKTPQFESTGSALGAVMATGYDPVRFSFKIADQSQEKLVSFYSNTKIDVTGEGSIDFTGWHLGAILNAGSGGEQEWLWKAAPTRPSDGLGAFEQYQQEQDVQFAVIDDNIFAICRGEFWKNDTSTGRQVNQILHFRSDGVFLGQFGLPTTIATTIPNPPGGANNLQMLSAVKVDQTIYVYVTEENCRGLHRWKILAE